MYSFNIRSVTTIEFTSVVLDGGRPSTDPNICYKRREYLIISEYNDAVSLKNAYTNIIEEGKLKNTNTVTTNKRRWIYCGNWNIVNTQNHTRNDTRLYSSSLLKSLHIVGNSPIPNNSSVGFIIVYVVRSAMPPLINDGKRLQQQHGFKAKVRHARLRTNKSHIFTFQTHIIENWWPSI